MRLEYDRDSENSSAIVAATIQAAKGDPELMALRDNGTSVALLSKAHTGEVHSFPNNVMPTTVPYLAQKALYTFSNTPFDHGETPSDLSLGKTQLELLGIKSHGQRTYKGAEEERQVDWSRNGISKFDTLALHLQTSTV